jgi:hypothetical protein
VLATDGATATAGLAVITVAGWAGCTIADGCTDGCNEVGEPANKYAEAGRPPSVSESPAFSA